MITYQYVALSFCSKLALHNPNPFFFGQDAVNIYRKNIFLFGFQDAVMSELRQKQKQKQIREKKVLKKEEVYHGALEDILLGMILFVF